MKRKFPLIIMVLTVLATTGAVSTLGPADDGTPAQSAPGVSGYTVHIDPATGEPTDPAPGTAPVVFDKKLQNALSTSPDGLVEVDSPVEGGGTMVDLQGRFQNTMVSVVDEDGNVSAPCLSALPDSAGSDGSGTGRGGEER